MDYKGRSCSKHGRYSTVFKVDYKMLTSGHLHDVWHSKHRHFSHSQMDCNLTTVCPECTFILKHPQFSATTARSVLCAGKHGCWTFGTGTGSLSITDNGLAKRQHWVFLWDRHEFEDVWLALLVLFIFFQSKNITKIYAQMCTCDWTKCNMVKMQQVFHHNRWWTYVNKTASGI